MRLSVQQPVISWAIERARAEYGQVAAKHTWIGAGSDGSFSPTFKQLEKFAKDLRVPFGFLLLDKPPEEKIPIPDFRTMPGSGERSPSPDLLDTIYLSQNRQSWYRDYVKVHDAETPDFVGSVAAKQQNIEEVAGRIREKIQFSLRERAAAPTWTEALSKLVKQTDDSGVLVMVNGVVGNNTRRALNPEEFRGFALCDALAPLIFVNGADTKSAQMFTIIHELAHIWAGESALTDSSPEDIPEKSLELWCDKVSAEVLVPEKDLRSNIKLNESTDDALARLARIYKVSTLVILRRLFDVESISQNNFWSEYEEELSRLKSIKRSSSGGSFYNTQNFRVSRRFAKAVIESALSGETLYGDALRLMSIGSVKTLKETARRLEVI